MRLIPKSQKSLSTHDTPLQLAAFGALAGILAGLVVNLFRFVLEAPFTLLGLPGEHDNFEALPYWLHFLLPLGGGCLLALLYHFVSPQNRSTGVVHVIDKVQNFKGRMPVRNALLQFAGGAIALLSGQSCGREGPAIHLGAASSSFLGQRFHLPNNATRTLIACGSAAAIAASFNTPVAGVIFSMEVIMMEYAIAAFLPVIIAAVSGAVITQVFYGPDPVFQIADVSIHSLWELPCIILMGVAIGTLAGLFVRLNKYILGFSSTDLRKRLVLAGLFTGLLAVFIPQVMGTGYDTLNNTLQTIQPLSFLLPLLMAKLVLSAVILGLGIPAGVIGPTLVIGGLAGASLGIVGNMLLPVLPDGSLPLYVLLGMCAMMGAVLQAPLAALMALLELSGNPNLILPAMLIIVVAHLTASEIFGGLPVYQQALQQQGIKTPKTLSRLLNRYGVNAVLNRRIATFDISHDEGEVPNLLAHEPDWIVLLADKKKRLVAANKVRALAQQNPLTIARLRTLFEDGSDMQAISLHATLQEAMETLQDANLEYGYIHSPLHVSASQVLGIISVDDIIAFYKDR